MVPFVVYGGLFCFGDNAFPFLYYTCMLLHITFIRHGSLFDTLSSSQFIFGHIILLHSSPYSRECDRQEEGRMTVAWKKEEGENDFCLHLPVCATSGLFTCSAVVMMMCLHILAVVMEKGRKSIVC